MTAAALILAAGAGRRLGRPKALVELGGRTLLQRAADLAAAAGCGPVVAVLRPGVPPAAVPVGVEAVVNPDPDAGMSGSLRLGLLRLIAAAPAEVDTAVVLLVDMPATDPRAVARVAAALGPGAPLTSADYGGRRAHPVGFHRSRWAEVAAALAGAGDQGARGYLAAHAEQLRLVDCADLPEPSDIDTAAQLDAAASAAAER